MGEKVDINKELLVQAIELHLKGRPLDSCELNTMTEYAPLIAQELAAVYGMGFGEFRQYVVNQERIELDVLKRAILGTVLSPINPQTGEAYFEVRPDGWGNDWKAGEPQTSTEKEIKANAPDGATHYKMSRAFRGEVLYFKQDVDKLKQWMPTVGWSHPFVIMKDDIKPL